ncbi:MAG: DUF6524 family protein [Halioglobus sp.]|jgi:hypothetical protein|uniref:DoxX family protein n=1 Tax=Candidatus Seongchinamella marina TaxID=2518990 RepID=A0ABT3STN8_9GAMM|nr:DUF6524 family protein [Candidatus Seongchinamella marina]EEB78696.1 hypothetical protein GPB2148_1594 [marine gamma proteobacterium HTCC2148]MBT3411208.1 hypothetical protein [Halieaceae bacterium]MDG2325446.1 DUF6524 family protein [Halioglobus sp.]MBT5006832.1 hypothetical protein [Halieaceae bacterium]MBT6126542.1 hypothetical protein [Halieaceae bacterium]
MSNEFNTVSFIARFIFAAVLVFGTYNPTDYSYLGWVFAEGTEFGPVPALLGVVLAIGWIIFLRASFNALGPLGIILGTALFSCVIWLLVDQGWLSLDATGAITWLALTLVALLLAVGMSWAHIRRRLSGQYSVDDVDD